MRNLADREKCSIVRADTSLPGGETMLKAILTDSHFWIPVVVLVLGIALLVYLH